MEALGKVFYRYGCSYSSSVLFAGSRCICMGLCVEDQLRLVPWTTYL
jgi:hypothetical protein